MRTYTEAGRRSVELHEIGLSPTACQRMTGVDPLLFRRENTVLKAMWGLIVASVAVSALVSAWVNP